MRHWTVVPDCPSRTKKFDVIYGGYLSSVVGVDVPDDPMSQRHNHRTTRLHLAFLREEGGPLAVEGACVHNEILCSYNRRELH